MRVGIEVGGTFTDLVEIRDGKVHIAKVPSTPSSPDIGVINAIDTAVINLAKVQDLVHGSTIATNSILERKGGRVGVIVTKGTRDIFALQRHDRKAIYDLNYIRPRPIAERQHVFEIEERLAADGSLVTPLDDAATKLSLKAFVGKNDFDAIAVCLLHSYVNPDHEKRITKILREIVPHIPVTCSVDVSREFREYERASTTVLSAYVQPIIQGYLKRLSETLNARSFGGKFSIMQSNGGRIPAVAMAQNAITALFSGPAAGVVGALGCARSSGFHDVITLDMGGTSTDVSLVVDGKPNIAAQTKIAGLPVRTPVIDIVTVGAGGGSIAWIDDGGFLRVGPISAGAEPGPASYKRGGTLPTITDAHLIRGTLQPESFLGGTMSVSRQAAINAFQALAKKLNSTVDELADSAIRIAEDNIVRAIQQVSTQRGHDPRDFSIIAYGGAGPLHAARLAENLNIGTVVVPPNAGVLSAAGLLMSDYISYRTRTERIPVKEETIPEVIRVLTDLRKETETFIHSAGIRTACTFEPSLEMRYEGQAFEISVPLREDFDQLTQDVLLQDFTIAHHKIFEFSKPTNDPIEIVSFRIGARSRTEGFSNALNSSQILVPSTEKPRVRITEGGNILECLLINRPEIETTKIAGPVLIQDSTSTIYVPPKWCVSCDSENSLILERSS